MADTICIRNGSFRATICLDRVNELTLRNYRKLLRIMCDASYENQDAIEHLERYLQKQVRTAKDTLEAARVSYNNGWRPSAFKYDQKENRQLETTLKSAEAAHEKAERLWRIFKELL